MSVIGLDPTSGPMPASEQGPARPDALARGRGRRHRVERPRPERRDPGRSSTASSAPRAGGTRHRVRAQAERVGAARSDRLGAPDLRRSRWPSPASAVEARAVRAVCATPWSWNGQASRAWPSCTRQMARQRTGHGPGQRHARLRLRHGRLPPHPARGVGRRRDRRRRARLAPQLLGRLTDDEVIRTT